MLKLIQEITGLLARIGLSTVNDAISDIQEKCYCILFIYCYCILQMYFTRNLASAIDRRSVCFQRINKKKRKREKE